MAAPAGTPSARARVRCGRNGLSSSTQPSVRSSRSTAPASAASGASPSRMSSHRARGRAAVGKAPARPIASSNGWQAAAARPVASIAGADPVLEGRPQEPKRQVQAVQPDPADVTATTGDAVGPDPVDDRGDLRLRLRRERDGDEQASAGQVGTRPAGSAVRGGHPGRSSARSPVSRPQAARSVRRTSSARSRSRQPRTSTVLSSSAL